MKKIVTTNQGVIDGVNDAVDTIKTTLGPKGKFVAVTNGFGSPDITRDGATVAKNLSSNDKEKAIGIEMVKRASQITEALAGDGTSSTAVLIQEMIRIGTHKINQRGISLSEVKDGMIAAGKEVVRLIQEQSIDCKTDIEKVRQVATISANNDPAIGDLIVECLEKLGMDAVITSDVSPRTDTRVNIVEGLQITRGWTSPLFVTDPNSGTCTLDDPAILVTMEKINNIKQLMPLMESLGRNLTGKPLLIICDDMSDNVLNTIVYNTVKGAIKACVIKGVDFGENRKHLMEDIACVVGAKNVGSIVGGTTLVNMSLTDLGEARKVVVSADRTTIFEGAGNKDEINARLEIIRTRVADPQVSDYDKHKYERRIASLSQGIAVIQAGGATDIERESNKQTIEDAVLASRSAIEEGVLPGSGIIIQRISEDKKSLKFNGKSKSFLLGVEIVKESLGSVWKTVLDNADFSWEVVWNNIRSKGGNYGYDVKGDRYGDLMEFGILDSTKVVRCSVENAVSTASMCLLIDRVVVDIDESKG